MKQLPFVLAVLVLAGGIPLMSGHGEEKKEVKALMQKKLASSQKILEGIAVNDYDRVAQHADTLLEISKEVEFRVYKTPQYEVYTNEFRRAAESLGEQARKKNTDGMALAYVELTLSCVKCHKHVREVRMARAD